MRLGGRHVGAARVGDAGGQPGDYVDQLVVAGPVESDVLGEDAVSFDGLVGIGRASAQGSSVAFSAGDVGVIVAVRTGEDGSPDADRPLAIGVAEAIATQL